MLEILNAQQELLDSEIDLINVRHDSAVIAYQLLAAAGELTAMSLALDVKLYDPTEHYNRAANAWFSLSDLSRLRKRRWRLIAPRDSPASAPCYS